jgi:hypothetical protein
MGSHNVKQFFFHIVKQLSSFLYITQRQYTIHSHKQLYRHMLVTGFGYRLVIIGPKTCGSTITINRVTRNVELLNYTFLVWCWPINIRNRLPIYDDIVVYDYMYCVLSLTCKTGGWIAWSLHTIYYLLNSIFISYSKTDSVDVPRKHPSLSDAT